jgi:hypothetical protein
MKKVTALWTFLFAAWSALAQVDTAFIKTFAKKNFVQLYHGSYARAIEFVPENKAGMQHRICLSPNSASFGGFILGYKNFVLYGDFSLPGTHRVSSRQTNVKSLAFFLSHFCYKWGITAFASLNRGLLMGRENMPMMYSSRNDLRMFSAGVHLYRIFNPKYFSYAAASSQQMLQVKSAGSLIAVLTPAYRMIRSSESIIPTAISKYHLTGKMEISKKITLASLQFKPGYAYNFVMKGGTYFFAPAVYAGAGADFHRIETASDTQSGLNVNAGYRFKLTTGINKKKYYITAEYILDHTRSYLYQSAVKNTYRECSINVGWRF